RAAFPAPATALPSAPDARVASTDPCSFASPAGRLLVTLFDPAQQRRHGLERLALVTRLLVDAEHHARLPAGPVPDDPGRDRLGRNRQLELRLGDELGHRGLDQPEPAR